jgi:hypothetical protein
MLDWPSERYHRVLRPTQLPYLRTHLSCLSLSSMVSSHTVDRKDLSWLTTSSVWPSQQ